MNRIITNVLSFIIVINLILVNNNVVNAEESDVIWLDNEYRLNDYMVEFSEGASSAYSNGKWGYIDKRGKEIVLSRYDLTSKFSEGLARVGFYNNEEGYIDKTGKEIIPFIYNWAGDFSEGIASVQLDGKAGYIDKRGKEIIPFIYNRAEEFNGGLAKVSINDKWGYIDKSGNEVIPIKYDDIGDFSEGLCYVKLNDKYGFLDNKGKEIIPVALKYTEVSNFKGGLARVMVSYGIYKMGHEMPVYGFIDKTGKEIIPLIYNGADSFSEEYALVMVAEEWDADWGSWIDGQYGFIDKTGKEIIPLIYNGADSFSEGLAKVNKGSKWGYINRKGEEIISFKYDYGSKEFSEGLSAVELDEKWGYIDKLGKKIIPIKYDQVTSFKEGLAIVKLDGKYGIIENPLIKKEIKMGSNIKKLNIIKDNKKIINITSDPKDVKFTYISKNPDIIKVLDSGELVGLKIGTGDIEVIAKKQGYEDASTIIPIEVKEPLKLDLTSIKQNSEVEEIIRELEEVLVGADHLYFEDSDTLKELSKLINFIIKKSSRDTVKASKNIITVNDKSFKNSIKDAKQIEKTIKDLLNKEDINLNREIDRTIRIDGVNLKENKSIGLRLESSMLKQLKDFDFINISLGELEVTLDTLNLGKDFEVRDTIQMEIKPKQNEGQESYEISFMDEGGNEILRLENNIMINIPLNENNAEYSTVFFNDGKEIQKLGGQYDPITNTMEFGTKLAGEYYIVKNQKQYGDISHLDQDIQDAITFMTSKGFIDGRDDDNFDPDAEINRAEFTSFLVNTFYVLDKTLSTNFTDVLKESWYYNHVASSEKEGIVNGFPDGTFKGESIINREQIVAIAARALHEKKKYLYPENVGEYLSFIDNDDIGEWAKKDIALAYRETLIDMPDNRYFEPQKSMTRADATVIVYRLFQLLYETSLSELDSVDTSSTSIPIIPIAVGGGGIGLGLLGGYVFRRKEDIR